MSSNARSLVDVYNGWDGYNVGLVRAVVPLSVAQLAWRPAPNLRTTGELVRHIIAGRIGWFQRIPDMDRAAFADVPGAGSPEPASDDAAILVKGLEGTWLAIETALRRWTVDDLTDIFHLPYQGKTWSVPRQWIIWRILTHDVHHGGELALSLGIQGIAIRDLGDLGGHLVNLKPVDSPT